MKIHTTFKYALVSGTYWIANVFLVGYANVAMGLRGLDSFQIGIAFSGGAGIAILFQMLSAFCMDRYPAASVKRTAAVMAAFTLVITAFLLDVSLAPAGVMVLYMLVLGAEMAMDSVIYTMAMEIMNYGGNVNFGFCRGIGSISYAVIMSVSGFFLAWIGYERLLWVFLLCQSIFIGVALWMPNPRMRESKTSGISETLGIQQDDRAKSAGENRTSGGSQKGYIAFLNENRLLLGLLLGIALISMCGNIIENFQIDILREVGGDEKTMGISRGLSAAIEFPVMCSFLMLRKRFDVRKLLVFAMLVYCVRSGIYAVAGSVSAILAAQSVQGIAFSLYNLSSSCFVNESIPREDAAKGQAVIGIAIRGAGGILANMLGGYLIARVNTHAALQLCLYMTILSTVIITGAVVYSKKKEVQKENQKQRRAIC